MVSISVFFALSHIRQLFHCAQMGFNHPQWEWLQRSPSPAYICARKRPVILSSPLP